jgi:hypothetical protein
MKRFSPKPWFVVAAAACSFGAIMILFLGYLAPWMTSKDLMLLPHYWCYSVGLTAIIVFCSEVARPLRDDEIRS